MPSRKLSCYSGRRGGPFLAHATLRALLLVIRIVGYSLFLRGCRTNSSHEICPEFACALAMLLALLAIPNSARSLRNIHSKSSSAEWPHVRFASLHPLHINRTRMPFGTPHSPPSLHAQLPSLAHYVLSCLTPFDAPPRSRRLGKPHRRSRQPYSRALREED